MKHLRSLGHNLILMIGLLCTYVLQPGASMVIGAPQMAIQALVTQEIRYHFAEAGEVFLVWGIDGWQTLPEAIRPAGTLIDNNVMHTLMVREGDTFVTQVRSPLGVTLNYGFQIRK